MSRELNSWGSTASGDVRTKPVPPPPSEAGGSLARNGADPLAVPRQAPYDPATGHEVLMASLIDGTSPMVLDAGGYAYWPAWK